MCWLSGLRSDGHMEERMERLRWTRRKKERCLLNSCRVKLLGKRSALRGVHRSVGANRVSCSNTAMLQTQQEE